MSFGVKLLVGILSPEENPSEESSKISFSRWEWVLREMKTLWGPVERISTPIPFDLTDYYRDIAPRLTRRFVSFFGLFPPEDLALWKRSSGRIEMQSGPSRTVNIDPGFLDGAKLVLASTKDRAQRIPIAQDLFAEVTLRYRKKRWESFDYTFPDFRDGRYDAFLNLVRQDWIRETEHLRRRNHD